MTMRWVQIDILEKIHSNTNKYVKVHKNPTCIGIDLKYCIFFSYLGNIELKSQRTLKRNIEKLLPLINTIILFRSHVFFTFFFLAMKYHEKLFVGTEGKNLI